VMLTEGGTEGGVVEVDGDIKEAWARAAVKNKEEERGGGGGGHVKYFSKILKWHNV